MAEWRSVAGLGVARPFSLNLPSRRRVLTGLAATIAAPAVRAQAQSRELAIPISSTSFATAQIRVADILGCYAKNGLSVRFPMMDTGSNLTAALLSGSAQVILGGSGEQVAAWARGQEILTLVNVYWGLAATVVLAKEVAQRIGISPTAPTRDRLKALDGVLIAAPSPTSNYTNSFKGAAEEAGAKIRYTYMAQPAMVAALESGAIQGYTAGAPLWGGQVARGTAVVWVSGPRGDLPKKHSPASTTALQAMRSVAAKDPDLMRRVIDSYRTFSDLLEKSPGEVRGALGKLYPQVEPATMDVLFEAEHGAWKMRPLTSDDMKQEIAFMVASGASLPNVAKIDPAAMMYTPPK
jgi:ABC-type nitrate/sulfonate/bicarbonate transport system substrate-binding protein